MWRGGEHQAQDWEGEEAGEEEVEAGHLGGGAEVGGAGPGDGQVGGTSGLLGDRLVARVVPVRSDL